MTNNCLQQPKYAKNIGVICLSFSSFDNIDIRLKKCNNIIWPLLKVVVVVYNFLN